MNDDQTDACIALLNAAWPREQLEAPTIAVWAHQLRDIQPEDGLDAAHACISTCKFFPSVTEFRERANAAARGRHRELPGPKVKRYCGPCDGTGWYEVEQSGSSMAVIQCPKCDGSGEGSDLPPAPLSDDEQKANMVKLRADARDGRVKRWVVVRCWQGTASTMVPQPARFRTWTRWGAESVAGRMTAGSTSGAWYEVRHA